jgi:hypothetical protein
MLINEDPVLNSAVSVLGQSLDILGDYKSNLNTLENLMAA